MTTQQKKENLAAAIQAAKTIVDLLDDAGYKQSILGAKGRFILDSLRYESEELKEEN